MKNRLREIITAAAACCVIAAITYGAGTWGHTPTNPKTDTAATAFVTYTSRTNASLAAKLAITTFNTYTSGVKTQMFAKAGLSSPDIITPRLTNPLIRGQYVVGNTMTANTLCYLGTDGKMYMADNAAALTSTGLLASPLGNYSATTTGHYRVFGLMSTAAAYKNWSTGQRYYVGTLGAYDKTEPSAGGSISRVVGWALSATKLWFAPTPYYATK